LNARETTARVRRSARGARGFLAALFTEHALSKLVALLFAGVLLRLIDREIAVTLLDETMSIRVAATGESAPAAAGVRELVLVTESGVAVRHLALSKVRVTVVGSKKYQDVFREGRPLSGRILVRRAWLAADQRAGVTSRKLDGSETDFGVPTDAVKFEGGDGLQVDLDVEEEFRLPLEASFVGDAAGVPAAEFEPKTVRVLGARSWFAGVGALEKATVPIDVAGRSGSFTVSPPAPPDFAARYVRLAPGQTILAHVVIGATPEDFLDVERVPLRLLITPPKDLYAFELMPPLEPERPVVTVRLRGPKDRIDALQADEVRKTLLAFVDTSALVAKPRAIERTPEGGEDGMGEVETGVDVEVLRIPEGLRLAAPVKVDLKIKRRP